MERIFSIINSDDFDRELINLMIDLYSNNYENYFEELNIDEKLLENLNKEQLEKITKLAAIIEYIGNKQPKAKLYDWIYSDKLILEQPYTPGVSQNTIERIKRIFFAPKEFSSRNVFYDEETIKPV